MFFNTRWLLEQAGRDKGSQTPWKVRAVEHWGAYPEQLTFLLYLGMTWDYHSTPLHGDVEWSLCPSRCWFSAHQGQQTNPIIMGISQDLNVLSWLVLQLAGDVFLFFSPKLKRCPWSLTVAGLARCLLFCYASNMVEFFLDADCSVSSVFRALSRMRMP